MYFIDKIKQEFNNDKLCIFVDMDGVITDYNFGKPLTFKTKRPIFTTINVIKELSKLGNVELYILSICIKNKDVQEKNDWLDKYAPFFDKKMRVIISKESNPNISSKELKCNYLKEFISENKNNKVILIDDDNDILQHIKNSMGDKVILCQDSSIID